jgi:hypothetical protein
LLAKNFGIDKLALQEYFSGDFEPSEAECMSDCQTVCIVFLSQSYALTPPRMLDNIIFEL